MQPTQSSATHPHVFDQLVCLRVRACPAEGFSDGLTTDFYTHTHTHPLNGPLSGTTRVSRYQKGKTNLDFTEARDSEWQ